MPEDQIKLAFSKVKQDIQTIFDELLNIKKELSENKENVKEILLRLESIKDGFSMLSFVIPEVKRKRGYFGTEFKFVDFGKINSFPSSSSIRISFFQTW